MTGNRTSLNPARFAKAARAGVGAVGLALMASSGASAQGPDCTAFADTFVELAPDWALGAGVSSGKELVQKDTRLFLPMAGFIDASCHLSEKATCDAANGEDRQHLLSMLYVSGALTFCFWADAPTFEGEQAAVIAEFERVAPPELRYSHMLNAARELGGNVSEDKMKSSVEINGRSLELSLNVESN